MDVVASPELINEALREYPFDKRPAELYQPMEYLLGIDTERFYPLLTLWACYLFSGDASRAINPSLGVEIFDKFLMVHSDLLDSRQPANQQQTVQEKWNRNVAILSGDAMIFKAYELLIMVDRLQIKPVVSKFNHCFISVCEAKQQLLNNPEDSGNSELLKRYPGAVGKFCFYLGALIGGADNNQQEKAEQLGGTLAIEATQVTPGDSQVARYLDELDCLATRKQAFLSWWRKRAAK